MRKNGLLCGIFFLVGQAALLIVLKKGQLFAQSRGLFIASQILLLTVTTIWYLLVQPKTRPHRPSQQPSPPIPIAMPQPDEREAQLKEDADQKAALLENVKRLEEREVFSKQRLSDVEQEKIVLKERLSEAEGRLVEVQKTTDSCCRIIQDLTFEIDRLTIQLEQERRQHSVEIRALLRKEGDEPLSGTKKKSGKSVPAVQKIASPPVPSLLLLLSACQKGLDLHVANDWPAGEHRVLVRRKFFDIVQKMNATPLAVVSLEQPTEYFLSSKLPHNLSAAQVRTVVMEYKQVFSQLQRFEPYHVTDERIGGRWVAFRAAWDNLDDLITMTPL